MPSRFDKLWKLPDPAAAAAQPPPPKEAVPSDQPGTNRVFVADSAADALRQIRRELGPEAVVLQVRQIPASSFSRLWQKHRVEVVAGVHEKGPGNVRLNELLQRITFLNQQLPRPPENHQATPGPEAGRVTLRRPGPTAVELGMLPSETRQLLPLLPQREERAGERRAVQTPLNSPLPNPLPVRRGEGEAASRPPRFP